MHRNLIWTPPEKRIRRFAPPPPSIGYALGVGGRASQQQDFDPGTLGLTGWWRAPYSASPWVGTPSEGLSGNRNLTEATNPPAVGGARNGYAPPDFDGVNDQLSTALTIANFFTTSMSFIALINMDTLAVDGSDDAAPGIIADTGSYFKVKIEASGAELYFFNAGAKRSGYVAISTATWTMVRAKWSGTNLYIAKNAGAWSAPVASGAPDITTGTIRVGANYNATTFIDGRVAELMVADSELSDASFDGIRRYINKRYALAL